jgi:hypothetical protein
VGDELLHDFAIIDRDSIEEFLANVKIAQGLLHPLRASVDIAS